MTIKEFYDITKSNYDNAIKNYKDDNSLTHFIKMFAEDKSTLELVEAFEQSNYEIMINKAHTIKTLSNDFGLTNLYDKVCLLLNDLREDKTNVKDIMFSLLEEYNLILQNIIKLDEVDYGNLVQ
jgi:hypothetical protein